MGSGCWGCTGKCRQVTVAVLDPPGPAPALAHPPSGFQEEAIHEAGGCPAALLPHRPHHVAPGAIPIPCRDFPVPRAEPTRTHLLVGADLGVHRHVLCSGLCRGKRGGRSVREQPGRGRGGSPGMLLAPSSPRELLPPGWRLSIASHPAVPPGHGGSGDTRFQLKEQQLKGLASENQLFLKKNVFKYKTVGSFWRAICICLSFLCRHHRGKRYWQLVLWLVKQRRGERM